MEVLNDARRPIITICCLIPHIGIVEVQNDPRRLIIIAIRLVTHEKIVEVKNDPRYFHKLFMFA